MRAVYKGRIYGYCVLGFNLQVT